MAINNIPIWKENENRLARQQAMRSFMDANAEMTNNLMTAGSTQADGISEIVARVALKRIQAESAAKNVRDSAAKAETDARDKELAKIKERMQAYVTNNTVNVVV
jgi:hypothetical protein